MATECSCNLEPLIFSGLSLYCHNDAQNLIFSDKSAIRYNNQLLNSKKL